MLRIISGLASLSIAIASLNPIAIAQSMTPNLNIVVSGPPQVVFDSRRDGCDSTDTPDAPPRAFRDRSGRIHLLAAQHTLRQFIGTSLNDVRRDCRVMRRSTRDDRPEMYSDAQWLAAPYTLNGQTIYAIIHNEFHGYLRPALCPSRIYSRCWFNSLSLMTSTDSGYSYSETGSPGNLIAALPYKYPGDIGAPIGYFQPSNIVELGGYYYVLFRANHYGDQIGGICLMRTNDLKDPASWRAWDGQQFGVRFVDPYRTPVENPQLHVCTPLKTNLPWDMGGLSRDLKSGAFILVVNGLVGGKPGMERVIGTWAAASNDLIHWSDPKLVWADPSGAKSYGNPRVTDQDPSLLDPTSDSRNFDTLGTEPFVYFVRSNPDHRPYDRRLMRMPVTIGVVEP
jgi:hypothetical protein